MAEQTKSDILEEPEKEKALTDEQRTVVQRNFIIMKFIWHIRPIEADMANFYALVEIGRNKYGSLVRKDPGTNPHMKKLADNLEKRSGVDKRVFCGDLPLQVASISDIDWNYYFDSLKEQMTPKEKEELENKVRQNNKRIKNIIDGKEKETAKKEVAEYKNRLLQDKRTKEDISDLETRLTEQLRVVPSTTGVDMNLYRLHYWLLYENRFEGQYIEGQLKQIAKLLDQITFEELSPLTTTQLEEYHKAVKAHWELIDILWKFKERKECEEKRLSGRLN